VLTDRTVDTRQFYGSVAGSWGKILMGSDFTVFNAKNIFNDLNLKGFGYTSDALGYISPEMSGFTFTAALVDPTDTSLLVTGIRGEESSPRIEAEVRRVHRLVECIEPKV